MALIPLYEAKTYLRVDSSDEDALIGILLSSAEQMCKDVGRLSEDQWEAHGVSEFHCVCLQHMYSSGELLVCIHCLPRRNCSGLLYR